MLNGPMKPFYKRVRDQDPKEWNNIPICLCESLKNMSQSIMDLHSTVNLQNKGMLELVTMITDQGISIRDNIAEGMELIRGKTILIAESIAEDRPIIL